MTIDRPRIVIAALRGGSGKTVLSLGLIAAWRETGHSVAPFKKGPDFIDPGWLALAADRPCRNLDPFLMTEDQILGTFLTHSGDARVSVIEGNRGLYDGLDVDGSCSTAQLARILKAPVLLIVDVTMTTRTIAALVRGCQTFDPRVQLAGVILNRVGGARQEDLIRRAVGQYCGLPVVGAIPKLKHDVFPERHMGLVPHQEQDHAAQAVGWTKDLARQHLDVGNIWELAQSAPPLSETGPTGGRQPAPEGEERVRIGIIRDRSFWFYYPENLEALRRLGAHLVEIDAMTQEHLPALDALYIGGGFPETQARALARNSRFKSALRQEIEAGLPVYAECGGFMYLGEQLLINGEAYPMVGALPVTFTLDKRPQGHGYTVMTVKRANPYFSVGDVIKGHEFHYSRPELAQTNGIRFAFAVERGQGIEGRLEGLCHNNLLATFTHVHATAHPKWASGLVAAAREHQKKLKGLKKRQKEV